MRIFAISLIGLSALALSACDELDSRRQAKAETDCCCAKTCPTAPPAKAETEKATETKTEVATETETVATTHARKGGRHWRTERRSGGYAYRSGTEGVGYLDEEEGYRGGYRGGYRREVSVEESETYSESRRSSESGYAYSASGGAYGSSQGYGSEGYRGDRRGGRGHGKRHRGQTYVGVDRDGYLTWPGKTP